MKKKTHNNLQAFIQRFLGRAPSASSKGFTLVETVVAILILSLSIGSLLTLAAGGFFSVRYARNQITADNLAQEALEYVRNNRDNAILAGTTWATWLSGLNNAGCSGSDGCKIDPYTTSGNAYIACSGDCPVLQYFSSAGFYGYATGTYPGITGGQNTTYVRTVTIEERQGGTQLIVNVRMSWKNGSNTKTVNQSMLLTNWNV